MKLLTVVLCSVLLLGAANIEMGEPPPDYGQVFGEIIMKAGQSLQDAAKRRHLKVKAMNDSLASTADAMLGMASHRPEAEIFARLDEARRHYRENSFPLLLKGILENSKGDTAAANRDFEDFLVESRTYTDFEKEFLSWDDFHKLRRVVYELLASRGVDFKGKENAIKVRVPFDALMKYVMNPSPKDRAYNFTFIFLLTIGTLFFFGAGVRGIDFSGYWMLSLLIFYVTVWVAYGFWIIDLAFGLPRGLSRFYVIPFLFGSVVCLRLAAGLYRLWIYWAGPLEAGYKRCPRCRVVLPELLLECPECGRSLHPVRKEKGT